MCRVRDDLRRRTVKVLSADKLFVAGVAKWMVFGCAVTRIGFKIVSRAINDVIRPRRLVELRCDLQEAKLSNASIQEDCFRSSTRTVPKRMSM